MSSKSGGALAGGLSLGAIIGIAVGGACCLCISLALCIILFMNLNKREEISESNQAYQPNSATLNVDNGPAHAYGMNNRQTSSVPGMISAADSSVFMSANNGNLMPQRVYSPNGVAAGGGAPGSYYGNGTSEIHMRPSYGANGTQPIPGSVYNGTVPIVAYRPSYEDMEVRRGAAGAGPGVSAYSETMDAAFGAPASELPFQCAQCGQRYQTANDLLTHGTLRLHVTGL